MIKNIPGQGIETPAMTFGIERYVPDSSKTPTTSNVSHFPSLPVKRFGLEDLLDQNVEDDIFVTREIERLVSNGHFNAAYELYLSDSIYDVPESFQEFINSQIGCDTIDE